MKTLIGIIAAAALAVSAPPATARDFRSADIHPADYPTVEAVKFMGKQLATASGGKLGVKVFPNGALGSEKDTIEQLKIGALDMMRINASPLNNFVPETIALCLPFVFRDTQHMRTVLDGPIGDEILAAMEPAGLVGLAYYDSGARSIYTVKAPVKSLADLKGLKIRVQQSDLWVGMIQSLGANPTPMPYGEVYTALKTENNWPSYESSRHFEAAKFYNVTEHSLAPEVLVMSKKVWDTLSKEDQAMVRKAAKESVPVMRKLWDEREQAARKTVEAAGVQVVTIANKAEFVDAMKPVYDKFAGDEKLKGLVKRIQDTK
jgi:tripartite ATP-independent transporter DctP family solute receptor